MITPRISSLPLFCWFGTALVLAGGCSSPPPTEPAPTVPALKPRLVCLRGLKESVEYRIREGHNIIGLGTKWRSAHVNLTEQELPGQSKIAPEHARLVREQGAFYLEDLNTTKGTFLNGQRLPRGKQQPLQPGDVIQIAAVQLEFLTAPDAKAKLVPLSPLRLVCVRGMRRGVEYLLFDGENIAGTGGNGPLEIDLDDQEDQDRAYLSPRHARLTASGGELAVEDLKSAHGTYVNRKRLPPGSKQTLKPRDVLQLGTVRLVVLPAEQVRSFHPPGPVKAQLRVVRGGKPRLEYRLYEGNNYVGRPGELAVDVDVGEQEAPDNVRSSLQHAAITCSDGKMTIEDLNSKDGTFVNRTKIKPGTKVPLQANDRIQIGTVEFRVTD